MGRITVSRVHLFAACLMGAAGVALLAAGAHMAGGQATTTAAQMLLFHASAAMAATLGRKAGSLNDLIARYAIFAMLLGVALFSADMTVRAFGGERLFAMAAPMGGGLTILSWIGLAASALVPARG